MKIRLPGSASLNLFDSPATILRQLEALGEQRVRYILAARDYIGEREIAEEWLRSLERKRAAEAESARSAREEGLLKAAQDAAAAAQESAAAARADARSARLAAIACAAVAAFAALAAAFISK